MKVVKFLWLIKISFVKGYFWIRIRMMFKSNVVVRCEMNIEESVIGEERYEVKGKSLLKGLLDIEMNKIVVFWSLKYRGVIRLKLFLLIFLNVVINCL